MPKCAGAEPQVPAPPLTPQTSSAPSRDSQTGSDEDTPWVQAIETLK